jgi:hypothetical protein
VWVISRSFKSPPYSRIKEKVSKNKDKDDDDGELANDEALRKSRFKREECTGAHCRGQLESSITVVVVQKRSKVRLCRLLVLVTLLARRATNATRRARVMPILLFERLGSCRLYLQVYYNITERPSNRTRYLTNLYIHISDSSLFSLS